MNEMRNPAPKRSTGKLALAAVMLFSATVSPVFNLSPAHEFLSGEQSGFSAGAAIAKSKSKSKAKPHDALIKEMLSHEGYKRTYFVHAPPSYNPQQPTPVLLVFHQEGSDARAMSRLAQFHELADQNGFLVVYPEGVKGMWNDSRRTDAHQLNDVGFVNELLTALERKWHIDRTGVYAVGYSDGGFFAQYLALKLQGRIKAVASVAGTLSQVLINKMRLKGNCSIMYILGMDDKIVPFYGGPIAPGAHGFNRGIGASASECINFWIQGNKCGNDFQTEDYPDVDGTDGTSVKVARYANCPDNHEVIIYAIKGGGHGWPHSRSAGQQGYGRTSRDFDSSAVIFQFMARQGLARLRPYR